MRGSLVKVLFVVIAVILVGSCGVGCASYFVRNEYEATVSDKQIKRQDKEDTYLVFTKLRDGSVRVFKNTDSLLYWKFNSSDVFAKLEKGRTYRIKAYGWRIPFLSMYENIIFASEVRQRRGTMQLTIPQRMVFCFAFFIILLYYYYGTVAECAFMMKY